MTSIRESIDAAVSYLREHPHEAGYTDSVAVATMKESLRVEIEGPDGERLATDMPGGVGGLAEHPSPGWLFRAALASCVAATVAMEAAREGVDLEALTVEVDSESDDRGILGIDPDVPAGPSSMAIRVRANAPGVDPARLESIVATGAGRCPVSDAVKRSVAVSVEIESN